MSRTLLPPSDTPMEETEEGEKNETNNKCILEDYCNFFIRRNIFMLQFEQAKMSLFRMSATMVNLAPRDIRSFGQNQKLLESDVKNK